MNRKHWSVAFVLFAAPFLLSFALIAIARAINASDGAQPTYQYEDIWLTVVHINWLAVSLVGIGLSALYVAVISFWNRSRRR